MNDLEPRNGRGIGVVLLISLLALFSGSLYAAAWILGLYWRH